MLERARMYEEKFEQWNKLKDPAEKFAWALILGNHSLENLPDRVKKYARDITAEEYVWIKNLVNPST